MKIALAGTLSGRGGVQTHIFWLSKAFLEAGHEVTVFTLSGELTEAERDRAMRLNDFGPFQIIAVRSKSKGFSPKPFQILFQLLQLKPHLYIAFGTGWNLFLPAILGCQSARRVFHEVMSGESSGPRDTRIAVRYGFHDVIAQARPVAVNFKKHFAWTPEIEILPAFPEPLEITAGLPKPSQQRIATKTAKAALFSRLVSHKGTLWLVNQWPMLSQSLSELHIHGSGPEEPAIRQLIEKHNWQDRVFLHGPYPEGAEYVRLLSSYDLTLLPTTGAEGAPLVLLESMACGVPFVAYGAGGIPDYANPDCCIVPTGNGDEFLEAVAMMVKRLALGDIDSTRLQRFYLDHFSFFALKNRWIQWLEAKTLPAAA